MKRAGDAVQRADFGGPAAFDVKSVSSEGLFKEVHHVGA